MYCLYVTTVIMIRTFECLLSGTVLSVLYAFWYLIFTVSYEVEIF